MNVSEIIQQILDHPERFDAGDAWPCQIQTLIRIAQEQRLRLHSPQIVVASRILTAVNA